MVKRKAKWCSWCRMHGHEREECRNFRAHCIGLSYALEPTTRPIPRHKNRTSSPSPEDGPSRKKARQGRGENEGQDASVAPVASSNSDGGPGHSLPQTRGARPSSVPSAPLGVSGVFAHSSIELDSVYRVGNVHASRTDAGFLLSLGPLTEGERQVMRSALFNHRQRMIFERASASDGPFKEERARSSSQEDLDGKVKTEKEE